MLLDEWHIQVEGPSQLTSDEAAAVRAALEPLITRLCRDLQVALRAQSNVATVRVRGVP